MPTTRKIIYTEESHGRTLLQPSRLDMLLPSSSTLSASCTILTWAAPASDCMVSAIILSRVDYCKRRSRRIASVLPQTLWLHCSVSSMLRRSFIVTDLHPHDHVTGTPPIYIDFQSKLESCTNCALWCMRLVLRRVYIRNMLTPVTELSGRSHLCSAIWIIRCAAHTNGRWFQVASRLPDQQQKMLCQ